jgi:hypothetical protein
MFKCFGQIFWGLLLVILDININHIDILPDFIGYILVAMGCRGLATISRGFVNAATLSWILAVFALTDYVPMDHDVSAVLSLVHLALDCTMMWFLLGGVMEFAAARHRMDLSLQAAHRRIAYIALTCAATFIAHLAGRADYGALTVGISILVCILILLFLILRLICQVRHELTGGDA